MRSGCAIMPSQLGMFLCHVHTHRLLQMQSLQAAIKYEQDDLAGTKTMLGQCISDDAETIVSTGCVAFKEEKYEEARQMFTDAMQKLG